MTVRVARGRGRRRVPAGRGRRRVPADRRRRGSPTLAILAIIVVALGLAVTAAHALGYRTLVISSGSMRPALEVGDLVISRSEHPGGLHRDDIVTFADPLLGNRFVTHRVVAVLADADSVTVQTRGDANLVAEHWTVPADSQVGAMVAHLPAHGTWLLQLRTRWARIAVVLLSLGWLVIVVLRRIWTN